MASVFLGYDTRMERDVAIKLLPKEFLHDPQFSTRFEREAKTIAALEHPAIAPIYDYGDDNGQPFIVMRYMAGGSLSDRLKEGKLSFDEIERIVTRIAPALDYAHAKGIVHRDLKPDNILFDQHNQPYIADFGIVKLTESTSNITGSGLIGTPAFMSPEQAEGKETLDGRSDVYSLGVILFHLLTGQSPFQSDTPIGLLLAHIKDPVPDILEYNSELPHEFNNIIVKVLAKDRDQRYATAGELSIDLSKIISHKESVATTQPAALPPVMETAQPEGLSTAPIAKPDKPPKKKISPWVWVFGMVGLGVAAILVFVVSAGLFKKLAESVDTDQTPVVSQASETPAEIGSDTSAPGSNYPSLPELLDASRLTEDFISAGEIMVYDVPDGYDVDAEMQKGAVNFSGRAELAPTDKVYFPYGWCAVDDLTLDQNLNYIDYQLTLDGVDVTISAEGFETTMDNGWPCMNWYLVMQNWPAGEHLLVVEMTISDTIDDGVGVYPAAIHHMEYVFAVGGAGETGTESGSGSITEGPDTFEDDFSDSGSGWTTYDGVSGYLGYTEGGFLIEVVEEGRALWTLAPVEYSDVIVEVDAAWVGGESDNDFGIICRRQSSQSFYSFVITSDGLAALQYVSEAEGWGFLGGGWIETDLIYTGLNEVNRIRAECIGDRLTLYINGERAFTVSDTRFSHGTLGLIATAYNVDNTQILFDNFSATIP